LPWVLLPYLEHDISLRQLRFDAEGLVSWDSSLPAFLLQLIELANTHQLKIDETGLPTGIVRLLHLARSMPKALVSEKAVKPRQFFKRLQSGVFHLGHISDEWIIFLGDLFRSFGRLLIGRARYSLRDIFELVQENGVFSLLMVSFISFLVGVIFSFIEATQLKIISAQLFLANVMAVSIVRELAPIMTGIFMAGRTGAAYAAQIGVMQLNDEVDALETTSISPIDFLVMPRVLTLALLMPLLYLYSMIFAILGTASLDVGLLGVSIPDYLNRLFHSIHIWDLSFGLLKSMLFGFLIGLWSCFYGMKCKSFNLSVGDATRNAVVTSIISIIMLDAVLAFVSYSVGR
jgi:phospholipid/cholesterol/gamma-HCH transport system permease protein